MPRLRLRIGLAEQRDQTGAAGVGDPRLGAVDHQIVAVRAGDRRHVLQIRAATRLGECHRRAQLTGRHARQVLLLLLPRCRMW